MHIHIVVYILSIVLFSKADSRFVRSHHKHRRNQQTFQTTPIIAITNRFGPIPPQTLPANSYPGYTGIQPANSDFLPESGKIPPENSRLPPGNVGWPFTDAGFNPVLENAGFPAVSTRGPSANAEFSSVNAGLSPGDTKLSPEIFQTPPRNQVHSIPQQPPLVYATNSYPVQSGIQPQNPELSSNVGLLPGGEKSNSDLSLNPSNANRKRRRKNVPEKNDKLEEIIGKKKMLLERSPRKNTLNKNNYLKHVNDYFENEVTGDITTLIPMPKGLQIKTASKENDRKVNAVVNITSSTQKSFFDNNTEIENVVEMQMEKKIEDDKGANRGSEKVRIVEEEHVKPVVIGKWNGLNLRKRRRKSYSKRFNVHHRSKRSDMVSTEKTRLNSVFNKMARRFFSAVRRKERVVDSNNFLTRQTAPDLKENGRQNIPSTGKITREKIIHDRDEMNDFVKFFLKQMQKFRKSRGYTKNSTTHLKGKNSGKWWKDAKFEAHKIKKINKNFEYPVHMNAFMNLNMTWDIKLKGHSNKYRQIIGNHSFAATGLETTSSGVLTTQQSTLTLVYIGERKDPTILGTILLSSIVTFPFVLLAWFLRNKFYKKYKFCHEGQRREMKGLTYVGIKNVCTEDYPQLEWQSENGDWLSEKETDFK